MKQELNKRKVNKKSIKEICNDLDQEFIWNCVDLITRGIIKWIKNKVTKLAINIS